MRPQAALALARILSEAVRNAISHGGASRIEVLVQVLEESLLVQVRNDGPATDPATWGAGLGMQSLLQSWGCECLTAESGADAMQSLERMTPELIITDFRLRHEETGKQVLQALRSQLGAMVPAIISRTLKSTARAASIRVKSHRPAAPRARNRAAPPSAAKGRYCGRASIRR